MTAHRQLVRLIKPFIEAGDTLLDVGCGSGYLFHAFNDEAVPIEYYGVDASRSLVEIGQRILPEFGLAAERLITMRIEDMEADVDHVACINVLSNLDNFHKPLERMLLAARQTVVLRESIAEEARYAYVEDRYLDPGHSLNVHVNTYRRDDILAFIRSYGFEVTFHIDDFTNGEPQMVIDHPHSWTFVTARRLVAP